MPNRTTPAPWVRPTGKHTIYDEDHLGVTGYVSTLDRRMSEGLELEPRGRFERRRLEVNLIR